MYSPLLVQRNAERITPRDLQLFWLAHVALGLPRIKTILRRRHILLITGTKEHLRRAEVLVSPDFSASDAAFWLPRRGSDWRAFSQQRQTRKRFGVYAKKTTRTPLGVGEPRPADVVSVPLEQVMNHRSLTPDEIRHLCSDLGYPWGRAVHVVRPTYCPLVSDYERDLQELLKKRREQIAFDEFAEKLKQYLWRSKYDTRTRRAIVKVLGYELFHDSAETAQYARKIARNARLRRRSFHVALCRVRAELSAADEPFAASESEMEAA